MRTRLRIELVVIAAVAGLSVAGAMGVFRNSLSAPKLVSIAASNAALDDAEADHIRMSLWPDNPRGLSSQQQADLLEAVLARQADASRPWHWLLSRGLETRATSQQLSLDQLARYAKGACPRPTFSTDPTSLAWRTPDERSGNKQEVFLFVHLPQGRGAVASQLQQTFTLSAVRINGQSVPDFTTMPMSPSGSTEPSSPAASQAHGGGSMPVPLPLKTGAYPLTYHVKQVVTWPSLPKPLFEDEWDVTTSIIAGFPPAAMQ